ncbi:ParB/RepB/Spo0J family partition protein (plasmid) [Streptomyces sp. NBC_00257]|uniref:ParB/RepB/Spo0J family partition protein n=1 Tax=unclassified Streptomyces TaxID=2593676 RepID=UPI0022537475|nr:MULTISPECIES: ParB/RepB/Spo0J family partition protein [unclassified Streptomyces]MCX4902285.1 ParB/RepB/Spo0J family partition protein [Streptomyces sp. NBC_00892]MCX5434624.1 ParB/RepB/Spo0J family partition protein [Streptomyces sp. NBC_00062]
MAGRRLNLATLAGAAVESTPGSSKPTLVHVAPDQVAPTPLNPRQDFDPVKLEELGNSMRTGQLQPCVGITRARYVKLFPEHEELLPDCRIVMAAGERRWKAAVHVGLPTLDVHVREDIAESRVRFLAAVLTENVERSNFNYIEEARGLQQMLEMTNGNQTQAAEKLQKSKQWFSQRIGLLRLSEEMQQLVISGELKAFRDMRMYSAMPPSDQLAAWKADRMAAKQNADRKGSSTPVPSPTPARETAAPAPKPEPTYTAVYTSSSSEAGSEQPEPRAEEPLPAESPGTVPREALPVPVPRDAAPESPEVGPPPAAKQKQALAANWERWFDRLMEELSELDRHMLTKKLQRVMLSETSRVEDSQA